jgi:hypothetical protein
MPFKLFIRPDLEDVRLAGDVLPVPAFLFVENMALLHKQEVQAQLPWLKNAQKELTLFVSVCSYLADLPFRLKWL